MPKFPWKYSRRVKNPSDLLRGPITEGPLVHCLSIKRRHKNDTKANSPAGHCSCCHPRWTNNSQPRFHSHYQSNSFRQRSETCKTQKPNHLWLPNFFLSFSFSLLLVFLLLSLIFLVGFLCRERWRCLVGFAEEKWFYKCKLCNGNATIEWSPKYDPVAINHCLCPHLRRK